MARKTKHRGGRKRAPSWYTRKWFAAMVAVLSQLIIMLASLSVTRILLDIYPPQV